jgi:choline dehydrogenase-like flavoprotein
MLVTRGVPAGYIDWAENYGLDDWGWEQVEPYFRKCEKAVAHPDASHRGHDGPIEIRQPKSVFTSFTYLEKAARAVGLPVSNDSNDPNGPAQGYFYLDTAVDDRGRRISAYNAWLGRKLAMDRRDHLAICTGVVASKLQIDGEGDGKHVSGVHIQRSRPGRWRRRSHKQAQTFYVHARREVIVCSGTLSTPQLLMLRYV